LILSFWFKNIDSNKQDKQVESDENNQTSLNNHFIESSSSSTSPAILAVQQDGDNEPIAPPVSPHVFDTENMYRGWFPTLQRTLWILSKLYHCVNVCFYLFKGLFCNENIRLFT